MQQQINRLQLKEYRFSPFKEDPLTEKDKLIGAMMNPVQLRFLENRFITLANERVRLKVPEDRALLESFLLRLVEIDGGITEIEQLVEAHNHALQQLSGIDSGTLEQTVNSTDSKAYDKAAGMVGSGDTI